MAIDYIGFIITVSIITLFVICPLIRSRHWFVRGFDFPRVHVLIILILFYFFALNFIQTNIEFWILNIFSIVSITLDVIRVAPYTKIYPVESKDSKLQSDKFFKIMSANIYIKNRSYSSLLNLVEIEKPDLLLLLETDEKWKDGVKNLESKFKFKKLIPQDNTYGMLLYSNFEFESINVFHLIDDKVPSIHASSV